jgi:MYXO-CTERM domain-containing protein
LRYRSAPMRLRSLVATLLSLFFVLLAGNALAAGTFVLKSKEVNEVSGAWHLYVTVELPRAPSVAHQPMKFLFTKTVAYERSLIDGHSEPVLTRQALQNQQPSVESLDVDFADPSGKIFKGTRFDFGLTRTRGYEAGEYVVEVKTSDGVVVGNKQNLVLKGDNEVVDRRTVTIQAKERGVKKVEAYDAGAKVAQNDEPSAVPQTGDVTPTGTATGFVPKEGYNETDEEKIKTKPGGCGCSIPGASSPVALLYGLVPLAAFGLLAARRRRK